MPGFGLALLCQFLVAESIYVLPHYFSFKCISSHFRGLNEKIFRRIMPPNRPSRLTLTRWKRDFQLQTFWAIQSQTTEAIPPLPPTSIDLPVRPHLVRLLVRSHLLVATGLQRAIRIKFHVTILDFEISR